MPRAKTFVFSRYFPFLLLLLLTLSPFCGGSGGSGNGGIPPQELWCVARNNAEDSDLLTAVNWACGAGGADCGPIQNGGPCYDPNDVPFMASYAFNDYFLKHGLSDDSCNFDNNAAVTALNPSRDKCKFPSSLTVSNGSFTGSVPSSSSVGLGPSEDMSGCSKVSLRSWFWLLSICHLLLMVSVFV